MPMTATTCRQSAVQTGFRRWKVSKTDAPRHGRDPSAGASPVRMKTNRMLAFMFRPNCQDEFWIRLCSYTLEVHQKITTSLQIWLDAQAGTIGQ